MLHSMRIRLICADYSFATGCALLLPESLRLWLVAASGELGTLREDNIQYPEPRVRTGRFWLTLCDALIRRRSDGLSLQVGSLLLPEAVTITEADAARGETEVAVDLGPSFRITQVDRQGRPVPNSEVSRTPVSFPREIPGDENLAGGMGFRTDAEGSARIFRPELFRLIPRPGCSLTIEPEA